jgi:hypothetical protein
MRKRIWNIVAATLFFALGVPIGASANCVDLNLTLQENSTTGEQNCPGGCRATMIFRCIGNTATIPGMTLIQTLQERNGKLCYRDMSCGNVNAWNGYIALSGSWVWYESFVKFIISPAGRDTLISADRDFNGRNVEAKVSIEWGQVRRSCKPISEEICM